MVIPLSQLITVDVQHNNTPIASRPILNFIGSALSVTDDAANNRVNINVNQGLTNAYTAFTDGTNTANAIGSDTFKFASINNTLSIQVVAADPIHGKHVRLDVIDRSSIQNIVVINGFTSVVRGALEFVNGNSIQYSLVDDPATQRARLLIEQIPKTVQQRIEVKVDSESAIRPTLRFLTSTGLAWKLTDDAGNDKVDLTLTFAGGTGSDNRIVKFINPESIGPSSITDFSTTFDRFIINSDGSFTFNLNPTTLSAKITTSRIIESFGTGLYNNTVRPTPPANQVNLYTRVIPGTPKTVRLIAKFENGVEVILAEQFI